MSVDCSTSSVDIELGLETIEESTLSISSLFYSNLVYGDAK